MILLLATLRLALAEPAVAADPATPTVRVQGALTLSGIPELDPEIVEALRPWQAIRSASSRGFVAGGGGVFVTTRFGSTNQLHRVAAPGAAREQLTFYDEPVGGVAPHPTRADLVVIQRDIGGNEAWQFDLLDLSEGTSVRLTDGTSRHEGFAWSDDGARFAYFGTARNGRDLDLYLGDTDAPAGARLALENEGSWRLASWGPGPDRLVLAHYVSITQSALYEVDLARGERRRLTPEGEVAVRGGVLAPDGRTLYLTSDHEGEFQSLYALDVPTGAWRALAPELRWDVEDLALSPDGRTVTFSVNERGYSRLYLHDARKGRTRAAEGLPPGQVSGLGFPTDRSDLLGLSLYGATSPSDAWTLDLKRRRATRWTASEVGGLPRDRFVEPELITWTSFDGLALDALLYRPQGPGPHPVVVAIHGGPESQSRPSLAPLYQALVAKAGCAVLVPNVRGSRGYGKTFLTLDNGVKREDSVKDIGALLDWIAAEPTLDAARVGVRGGSYGGYMVLASLVHFADRIAAGVDVVGISDFITFLENTSPYRRDLRRVEYGDERDPELRAHLETISPLRRASEIRSRLFVLHGANDPRVPVGEAEQIVAAVRAQGVPTWYLRAENEGHGFGKQENRDVATALEVQFFREALATPR
jgi:dipeptidyl aminopeptidase/acylaminoacyl peptidase